VIRGQRHGEDTYHDGGAAGDDGGAGGALAAPENGPVQRRVYAERIVLRSEGCALAPGYSQGHGHAPLAQAIDRCRATAQFIQAVADGTADPVLKGKGAAPSAPRRLPDERVAR
jgi:hypothetical protein